MKKLKIKEKDIELWLTIRNFPDYKISNWGRVFSKKINTYITGKPNTGGYWQVRLINDDGYKDVLIHKLVAEYFVPNLFGVGTQINHIDENKMNNRWDNLEWVTPKENINYGTAKERIKKHQHNRNIMQFDLDGNFIKEYPSASAAAKAVGRFPMSITSAANGKLKTSAGYIWRWVY